LINNTEINIDLQIKESLQGQKRWNDVPDPLPKLRKNYGIASNVSHRSKSNFTSSINNAGYKVPNTMGWTAFRMIAEQVTHVTCKWQLISREEEEKKLEKKNKEMGEVLAISK